MTLKFILIEGNLNVEIYKKACITHELEPGKAVFIFPGNSSHHTPGTNLFTKKSGGGLASVSGALNDAGFPTLSLPTTSMENWSADKEVKEKEIVTQAIADLYDALGQGYSLMLPVRKHKNTNYFKNGLRERLDLEPSFWGGIQISANNALADYYLEEINELYFFTRLHEKDRKIHAESFPKNRFYQTYLNALNKVALSNPLEKNELEYEPVPPLQSEEIEVITPTVIEPKVVENVTSTVKVEDNLPEVKKNDSPLKEPKIAIQKPSQPQYSNTFFKQKYPDSYLKFYEKNKDESFKLAKTILNDYTKNNSLFLRAIHFHLFRNHVVEVNKLVQQMEKGSIKNTSEVLLALKAIKNINPKGSLARRIAFIEEASEKANRNDNLQIS